MKTFGKTGFVRRGINYSMILMDVTSRALFLWWSCLNFIDSKLLSWSILLVSKVKLYKNFKQLILKCNLKDYKNCYCPNPNLGVWW